MLYCLPSPGWPRGLRSLRGSNSLKKYRSHYDWNPQENDHACSLTRKPIASSARKFSIEMDGVANRAGGWRIFKSITFCRGVDWAMIRLRIS